MPDIEQRFHQQYKDQGLVVIALDAHDGPELIGQVQDFVGNLGISYDVGLESTTTYDALVQNFDGLNPFPVDVIIDKTGRIRYITREYDPYAMTEIIEQLLAE